MVIVPRLAFVLSFSELLFDSSTIIKNDIVEVFLIYSSDRILFLSQIPVAFIRPKVTRKKVYLDGFQIEPFNRKINFGHVTKRKEQKHLGRRECVRIVADFEDFYDPNTIYCEVQILHSIMLV